MINEASRPTKLIFSSVWHFWVCFGKPCFKNLRSAVLESQLKSLKATCVLHRIWFISFYWNQWEYVIFDTKSIQFPKKKVKNTGYIMKLIHKNIEKGLGGSIGLIPVSVYLSVVSKRVNDVILFCPSYNTYSFILNE